MGSDKVTQLASLGGEHNVRSTCSRCAHGSRLSLALALALVFLFAMAASAFAAPTVFSPVPAAGATGLLPGTRSLSVQASDVYPLMGNSDILLDGVPTDAKFYFGQLWEYDPEIDEDDHGRRGPS